MLRLHVRRPALASTIAALSLVLLLLGSTAPDARAAVAATDCSGSRMCPAIYDPVCGSDGKTYSSACNLESTACANASLTLKARGECAPSSSSPPASSPSPRPSQPSTSIPPTTLSPSPSAGDCKIAACLTIYDPVCGSDGKTYGNECELRLAKCRGASSLTVASQGECRAKGPTGSGSAAGGATGAGAGVGTGSSNNSTGGKSSAQVGSNATDKSSAAPTPAPTTKSSASARSLSIGAAVAMSVVAVYHLSASGV